MADKDDDHCRLCLVTPAGVSPERFAPILDDALSGGDVASLIITDDPAGLAALAAATVPLAQARGVAALIHNSTRIAEQTNADGVHIDDGLSGLGAIVASLRPNKIVGVGGLTSRHDAMTAGDADPDYVFFGRLDGDTAPEIFDKAFDLAEWWASLFQIPGVVMGGTSLASVLKARDAGIEFVALRSAVWDHPAGAGAAIAEANHLLATLTEADP